MREPRYLSGGVVERLLPVRRSPWSTRGNGSSTGAQENVRPAVATAPRATAGRTTTEEERPVETIGAHNERTDRYTAIEAAAELMATNPGAAERTLELHDRRPDGRCTGCASPLTRWPCTIVTIARRAVDLRAAAGAVRPRGAADRAAR
jgi:hypothetical protein